jgi:hypothetical protein
MIRHVNERLGRRTRSLLGLPLIVMDENKRNAHRRLNARNGDHSRDGIQIVYGTPLNFAPRIRLISFSVFACQFAD